jgi:hypothetical protein
MMSASKSRCHLPASETRRQDCKLDFVVEQVHFSWVGEGAIIAGASGKHVHRFANLSSMAGCVVLAARQFRWPFSATAESLQIAKGGPV